ncbi:hypothetical protein B7486_13915 [cyanobacterium TDX16]|nr:hypothetical protein B7486_13915 [cyanobacterium TDX16]
MKPTAPAAASPARQTNLIERIDMQPKRLLALGCSLYLMVAAVAAPAHADEVAFAASEKAAAIDAQIDWSRARLIAVQDAGRYKTLDSFAREAIHEMYGKEHFPGLSPMATMMEWLFNRDAYADSPVLRIKDKGIQIHLSAHMPEAARQRIQQTGYMTPREFDDPVVAQRIIELEPMAPMVSAMRRVRGTEAVSRHMEEMLRIVPAPNEASDAMWHTIAELQANLPPDLLAKAGRSADSIGAPIPGVTTEQAVRGVQAWAKVWSAWKEGDAAKVQTSIDQLAEFLPTMAGEGVYPAESQRAAEASYYSWGKFTWGYWFYMAGLIFGIPALVTGWRKPWVTSIAFLMIAMGVHAFGIGLRWYILGRIPVANMFEAIVGSAWIGIAIALLVELKYRTRVALIGAHATGFVALMLAGFVVPGGGTITTIMGILDDLMLRIHTVLIIASYALIFVASIIAVVYLFGYYHHRASAKSAEFGAVVALFGGIVLAMLNFVFVKGLDPSGEYVKSSTATTAFWVAAIGSLALLLIVVRPDTSHRLIAAVTGLFLSCLTLAIGNHGFSLGMGWVMIGVGGVWCLGNLVGRIVRGASNPIGANPRLAAVGVSGSFHDLALEKPILAGALPGDKSSPTGLPMWLQHVDWSHLIILNMVFVMLFVGTILGAVWADYSWGRPWGWDPKEVFALNTWIVYAILIHMRFVTKNKGLWTAWLSVAGCLMMAFNWCFVNFYIVGLHSYA